MLHLIHPALVHFSVAFLVVGGLCEGWGILRSSERLRSFGAPLVVLGTISLIPTVVSGYLAANTAESMASPAALAALGVHERNGLAVFFVFLAAQFWKGWEQGAIAESRQPVYAILLLCGVALVLYGAFLGGQLVYGYGVGVKVG